MLKIKNKKIISLQNWNNFVRETYNKTYNFQQQDGCKSRGLYHFDIPPTDTPCDFERDSIPESLGGDSDENMGVSFKAWLERDSKTPIKNQKYDFELTLWWERHFYPSVDMIIYDLYKKGLLENGEYVIEIDW